MRISLENLKMNTLIILLKLKSFILDYFFFKLIIFYSKQLKIYQIKIKT